MGNIRIETDNLPDYTFPVRPMDTSGGFNPFAFTLVQGRGEGEDEWLPLWLVVDSDGTAIGRMVADDFEDLDPEILTRAALDFIFKLHGVEDYPIRDGSDRPDDKKVVIEQIYMGLG